MVGMRKKVEMGETGCKSKHGVGLGGQNQACFITRAFTGSLHTMLPLSCPGNRP